MELFESFAFFFVLLSPLSAEASFEKMLPSYFVLGVDESSEYGFSIVGIHLKNSLDQSESKVELSVMDCQSLS